MTMVSGEEIQVSRFDRCACSYYSMYYQAGLGFQIRSP
jgi:hypothetical protein